MSKGRWLWVPLFAVCIAAPSPASAHDIHWTIDNCACDSSCYSDEVTDVACTGGEAHFHSNGLPDEHHTLMNGITATNQQFPRPHSYTFSVNRHPSKAFFSKSLVPGAIGVAINGVPIFSPYTQGPIDPATGKRPSAYKEGELDECGGHAGRGDDYHYHIAPKCLIDDLGPVRVEDEKKPIGFAEDGFPILALGWFKPDHDIEDSLDKCRGATDAAGNYFYNVRHTPDWDVLDCIAGSTPRGFSRDDWQPRLDSGGHEIVGIPLPFTVGDYELRTDGHDACNVMTGTLREGQILNTDGTVERVANRTGSLFYCNAHCYGQFFEARHVRGAHGRVIYFERVADKCPAALDLAHLAQFEPYEGPPAR